MLISSPESAMTSLTSTSRSRLSAGGAQSAEESILRVDRATLCSLHPGLHGREVTRRLLHLFAIYFLIVGTAGVIFEFAEGRGLAESLWWAVVTATTVGYGDLSPVTAVGRVMATVLMHLTTLCVLPLLSAEIAAKLIVDRDMLTHDEQEEMKERLQRIERMLMEQQDRR